MCLNPMIERQKNATITSLRIHVFIDNGFLKLAFSKKILDKKNKLNLIGAGVATTNN